MRGRNFSSFTPPLASELLHLPGKPAGVGGGRHGILADELLHLPDKPAGVGPEPASSNSVKIARLIAPDALDHPPSWTPSPSTASRARFRRPSLSPNSFAPLDATPARLPSRSTS